EDGPAILVLCGPADLVDEIAGLASAQLLLETAANGADEVVEGTFVHVEAAARCDSAEDLAELIVGCGIDADLGLHAAEEGRVDQIGGVEVGRKDDEHFEGDLDFAAAGHGQE